jgi:prepilin-type N-terminal cleavage/methylation domain-containing protein
MAPTPHPSGDSGYSLIEVLVVLVIVGALTIVGVTLLGSRAGNSVRVVMDELEGAIMDAHKYAATSGRDVAIVTWGDWDVSGTTPTLLMARGDAAQTSLQIQSVANDLIGNDPTKLPTTDVGKSVAVMFAPSRSREYMNAGVVVKGSDWWTNAMQANGAGKQNEDLKTVVPFSTDAGFKAAYTTDSNATNLFQGGSTLNQVIISGANKRFTGSFNIQVVGMTSGRAVPGGAMGLLVVQNNGATVYRFYNPGVVNGDGKWRRI